ncbi:MAG: Mur ligase domain-containing protein, partial [Tabrizicola sp.]|nr:Mur ligase domain-containing protein [Tabrizicola sp.]
MTARAIRVSDLGLTARSGRDPALSGLTVDSRAVRAGMLFAALPGSQVHGARFIAAALERGAVAILTDAAGARMAAEVLAESEVALVVAEDPRAALA